MSDLSISDGAAKDIRLLSAGVERQDVALEALREAVLSPSQVQALLELARGYQDKINAGETISITTTSQEFQDDRVGAAPQRGALIIFEENRSINVEQRLHELLGDQANEILDGFPLSPHGVYEQSLAGIHRLVLIAHNPPIPIGRLSTHGEVPVCADRVISEEIDHCGLKMADHGRALVLCASVYKCALRAGLDLTAEPVTWEHEQKDACKKLSTAELELLKELRLDCVVLTDYGTGRHAGIEINDYGNLVGRDFPAWREVRMVLAE